MSKTKWWVSALVAILILVVLAGAGYAIYRLGYAHGQEASTSGQVTPHTFQDQPNSRNPNLGLRGQDRGIMPFTRAGGAPGFAWLGTVAGIVIFGLVIVALVLLIIFLFGKLGSKRMPHTAPVEVNTESGGQQHRQE